MATKSTGDLELWLPVMGDVVEDTIGIHLVENFNIIDAEFTEQKTDLTTHKTESVSELVQITRDLTLTGLQVITLSISKKPKSITSVVSVDNTLKISQGVCDEIKIQSNLYRLSGGNYQISTTSLIMISNNQAVDRTYGIVTDISAGSITIDWLKTGSGATGTATIRLLVSYHD